MSELLFECYNVPSVLYGIDALFSFHANGGQDDSGVVLSAGHNATHIIPTLKGKGLLERTKRISFGGTQSTDYMLKLMQLKYPTFPTKMTATQAQVKTGYGGVSYRRLTPCRNSCTTMSRLLPITKKRSAISRTSQPLTRWIVSFSSHSQHLYVLRGKIHIHNMS